MSKMNSDLEFFVGVGVLAAVAATFIAVGVAWFSYGSVGLAVLAVLVAGVLSLFALAKLAKIVARAQRAAAAQAEWERKLSELPVELHRAANIIADYDDAAPQMWANLGLGRVGDFHRGIAPAFPTLVPWPDGSNWGMWPTGIGARVRLEMLAGQSPRMFEAKRAELAVAFDIPSVRVSSAAGSQICLDLQVFDPLTEFNVSHLLDDATAARVEAAAKMGGTPAEETARMRAALRGARLTVPVNALRCTDPIPLMMSEFGDWVTITLAAGGHGAVQGATRSGKSITLNSLLAWANLMVDTRVVIIDPNTAAVAPWWQVAHLVYDGTDAAEATAVLNQVYDELTERKSLFWEQQSDKITTFDTETPLYVIVVDEVAEYAKDTKFQDALRRVGAQTAKFGGRLYLAGQKLDSDSLSMGTRANLFDRICHRVESRHEFAHLFEDTADLEARGLNAADGRNPLPQGVAIVRTRSHPQAQRARSVYLPTEACWLISQAIVAERGAIRPLPGQEPKALPERTGNDTANAIINPAPTVAPAPVKRRPGRDAVELPAFPEVEPSGTVLPFDRLGRFDRTEGKGQADRAEDTGTE